MKDFEAYSIGIVSASVCTSLSLDKTTERLNTEHSPGEGLEWRKSDDKEFASGQPNPTTCEQHPKTHKHYLFNC